MAVSVIDALVITLGLDASDYQKKRKEVSVGLKDAREEAQKTAKEMENQGKRAAGFFSSIKNEMLALAGVSLSVAGMSSFVRNTTSGLQQMAVQSQALGMSARQLDGWSKAAQAAGSSAEKITGTLGNFQNAIQAYRNGDASSPIFQALAMLNGDTGVTFDPMRQDSDSMMRTAAQAIRQERSGDRARYIAQMLGIDDATFQSMRTGQFTRDADRYGKQSGITDADVKNAQKFNREWTDLQQKLEKTGYVIFNALSPCVDQFTGYLTRLAEWMAQHPKEIEGTVTSFFGTLSGVVKVCDDAAQAVGGWKNVILGLIGLKVVGWALGFARALKTLTGLSVSGGGKGAGLIGKAGVAGTIAVAAEPYVDQGLNSLFGKNDYYQRLRTAKDWSQFGEALFGEGDAKWVNGKWVDNRGTSDKQLDALKKGQDDARRDDKRTADESKGQRNRTNELLSNLLNALFPQGQADTLEPNLVGQLAGPPEPSAGGKKLLDSLTDTFSKTEERYNLPAGLLRSVATAESSGNASAVSPAGAQGLFQFMPATAREMGLRGSEVFDPEKATEAAGRYLRQLLNQTGGRLESALAAYNWGIGNVQKKGLGQAPRETRQYVPKVLAGIRPGAGMSVDRAPPHPQPAQTAPQYNISNLNVQSAAGRIDQLTADASRAAQNRVRALGFDSRQS